jgi:uncharacterized damage-inducible protein DinB
MSLMLEHARLMAQYNRWMNGNLIAACEKLPHEQLVEDKHAFFGSILGTLNHLVVADLLWLRRFRVHRIHRAMDMGGRDTADHACSLSVLDGMPTPSALNSWLYETLPPYAAARRKLDDAICTFVAELGDDELQATLHYRRMNGEAQSRKLGLILMHFFNHQTHHRGQVTTLLMQCGVDPGVTDYAWLLPQCEAQPA